MRRRAADSSRSFLTGCAIRIQEDTTERLIGWVQLAVVLTFSTLYAVSPKTFPADQTFEPVPWVIVAYFLFTLLRLLLAYRTSLPDWFLFLSIVTDMSLLFGLIWSFHMQYGQPASFYLKAPTLLYIFIFIACVRFVSKRASSSPRASPPRWDGPCSWRTRSRSTNATR